MVLRQPGQSNHHAEHGPEQYDKQPDQWHQQAAKASEAANRCMVAGCAAVAARFTALAH